MKWNKASLHFNDLELLSSHVTPIGFPAFAPIVSDAFDHLKDLPPIQHHPCGHVLLDQGSTEDAVYLLRSGLVKLVHTTPDGHLITLGLRSSGSCLGAVSALAGRPNAYSVTAITPCAVSRLPAAELSAKLMQNTRLLRHFLNSLCNDSMSQSACQVQMMGCSAEDRLHQFMLERGAEHTRLKTLDTLPMLKQMDLAQLLSITPEHLSRLMHKVADPSKLDSLAEEELTA